MADKKISELNSILGSLTADDDLLVIVDSSTNETKKITKAELASTINAALIDGAPAALDTLNELAAALADDANFASTVTNSIATKVSKSGDTMTGNLDVQGTVTADGLTVDDGGALIQKEEANGVGGLLQLKNTRNTTGTGNGNRIELIGGNNDTRKVYLDSRSAADYGRFPDFVVGSETDNSTERDRLKIAYNGDISFYEDTGTTPKFFWDASAESLTIGGSSSSNNALSVQGSGLHVRGNSTAVTSGTKGLVVGYEDSDGTTKFSSRGTSSTARGKYSFNVIENDGGNNIEALAIDSSGNVGIGTSSPSRELEVQGTGNVYIKVAASTDNDSSAIELENTQQTWTIRNNDSTGDSLEFVDDAVVRMTLDTNGHLGIGKAPVATLDVNSGTTNEVARFSSTDSTALINIHDSSTTVDSHGIGAIGNNLVLFTAGTEKARIDSSGNLLVGKTSGDLGTVGTAIFGSAGAIESTRSGNKVLTLNRLSSDGEIAQFRKDGSTVGSIGVGNSNDLYIGSADTGLMFKDNDIVDPWNPSANSQRDNAIDLGSSLGRFKDLYLSGGVYLGGTGSANHFDDYETGTFDVTNDGDSTGTITQQGQYVKSGSLVHVQFQVRIDTNFTSNSMAGLPFVPKIASGLSNRYGIYPVFSSASSGDVIYVTITDANDQILFYLNDSSTTFNPTTATSVYRVCMTYETAS